MLEYRYDTQLLIDGTGLDEDQIFDYIQKHFAGYLYFSAFFLYPYSVVFIKKCFTAKRALLW